MFRVAEDVASAAAAAKHRAKKLSTGLYIHSGGSNVPITDDHPVAVAAQ